ncbi:MAG: DNA polymerase IV [Coriobacteriia bacterium]|nr:DNA polymerase IV [Coriobacteriia bacterium]
MDDSAHEWQGRAILHVDMDAFFASVEQLDNPQWRGLPVIVGGLPGGRGVVSAASYEASRHGVRSAMPSSHAARLCPDAVWAHPRFDRYSELSAMVCEEFRSVTPIVQQVSIDEAYLDVSPTPHLKTDPLSIARSLQHRIDELGLSCSIGLATTKTVAKIASDCDKPHGITTVLPGTEGAFLAPLPVTALPGVGTVAARRLREVGIRTLGELARLDQSSARQLLGSTGTVLVERAGGVDDRPVVCERDAKSVSSEQTFSKDVHNPKDAESALRSLVQKVASRLRSKHIRGRTLTVKLRYADFTTHTTSRTIALSTDLEGEMLPVALELLHGAWAAGAGLRLLGFSVSGFGEPVLQLDLLSDEAPRDRQRSQALAHGIDAVRERFGSGSISVGSQNLEDVRKGEERSDEDRDA